MCPSACATPAMLNDAAHRSSRRSIPISKSTAPPAASSTVKFTDTAIQARQRSAVDQSIEIVRRRIDETGTKEPTIQREGEDRILVQLPGVDDPEHVKELLGRTAKMTFQLVGHGRRARATRAPGHLPPGDEVLPSADKPSPAARNSTS